MVFHRTASCHVTEYSCEREVVRLTLGLHRGQGRSQSRDHACCPRLCPGLQGAGSVGSTPSGVLPAAPPPPAAPLPSLQGAQGQGQVRGSSRRTLPAGSQYRLRDTWPDGVLLFRPGHSSADDSVSVYLGSVHSHETIDISTCEHKRRAGDSPFINQSFGKR